MSMSGQSKNSASMSNTAKNAVSLAGLSKNSVTMGNTAKNTVAMNAMNKAGAGWDYDDPNLTYDATVDADGRVVYYDGVGQSITMTPLNKNTA